MKDIAEFVGVAVLLYGAVYSLLVASGLSGFLTTALLSRQRER